MTTAKKWGALALVLVLTVAMVLAGLKTYSVRAAFLHSQDSFQQLQELANNPAALATPQGLATLRERLDRAQQDLAALKKELGLVRWLLPWAARLPGVDGEVGVIPGLVDLGMGFTQAVSTLVDGLTPLVELGPQAAGNKFLERAIEALEQGRPRFQAAAAQLEKVERLRQALTQPRPGSRSERVFSVVDTYLPQMQAVARLGLEGPGLLRSLQPMQERLFTIQQKVQGIASDPVAILKNREGLAPLETELAQTEVELGRLSSQLAGFTDELGFLSRVPTLGGDVRPAPQVLSRAAGVARAARLALAGAQGPLDLTGQGLFAEDFGSKVGQGIVEARAGFQAALAELNHLPKVEPKTGLSPLLSGPLQMLDTAVPQMEQGLEAALDYLRLAETVLGFDRPRTYLVLGQKEEELKATGGFIGTVWEITLDRGVITRFRFMHSFDVERPEERDSYPSPPEPMLKYMWAGKWLFRDSNWYADFPTSAKVAQGFYQQGQGVRADGVIALTRKQMEYLVAALGPIPIPEANVIATSDNVRELLAAITFPEGVTPPYPRARIWFAQLLGNALYARLKQGLAPAEMERLTQALLLGLTEKQILVYMEDGALQAFFRQKGWDGALLSPEGDYLFLVDQIMSGIDSEAIQRRLNYQVVLNEEGLAASRLTIALHNAFGSPSEPTLCFQGLFGLCYWTYIRLYLPSGSTLVSAPFLPLPEGSLYYRYGWGGEINTFTATHSEGDKLVLGGFLVLALGEQRELTFAYQPALTRPPPPSQPYEYRLMVQRQPGTAPTPVSVSLSFPREWRLTHTEPEPQEVGPGLVVFHALLDTDRAFSAVFQRR